MEERCDLSLGFWKTWWFYVKYLLLLVGNGTPWVACTAGILLYIGAVYLWMPMFGISFWGVFLWGSAAAGMSIKNQCLYWPLNRNIVPPVWSLSAIPNSRHGARSGREITWRREQERRQRAAAARAADQQTARANRQATNDARRQEERVRLAAVDTGMGQCPNCGNHNVIKVREAESDGTQQVLGCGCMALLLGIFALFTLPILLLCTKNYTGMRCMVCGHRWPA